MPKASVYPDPFEAAQLTPTSEWSNPEKLFDVTAVIGSVYKGGQFPPRMAAFMLIADHNASGEYSFPEEDASLTIVRVETGVNPEAYHNGRP